MKRFSIALLFCCFLACIPKNVHLKPGNPDWGVQVTWHGHSCFTLRDSTGRTIVIDPFDDTVGYEQLYLRADALFVTHNHFDHNNKKAVKSHYENIDLMESTGTISVASDLLVTGIESDHDNVGGNIHGHNIIFTFYMGGLRMAHLGDLGQTQLTAAQLKLIGPIDVLFVPVGGVTTIDGPQAKVIVEQLKPGMIFPMHYGNIRLYKFNSVDDFTILFSTAQVKKLDDSSVRVRKADLNEKPVITILRPTQKNY